MPPSQARSPMPLVVRLALAGLLALGLVPGIPGFDLLLAAISGREATASAAAARGHPELPEPRPWAEASTTDLIAALAVWSPVRSPSRTAWPFKSHDGQPFTTPPGLTVAATAAPPAVLIALPFLSALGLRWIRALRAPPIL